MQRINQKHKALCLLHRKKMWVSEIRKSSSNSKDSSVPAKEEPGARNQEQGLLGGLGRG
jgi:hypothetical protein